ncbi:(deoxy)nucleoside triphosphate pyrophosphohydrolase [Novosphingobium bradum]|uniref:8-oxo-dGTP diphosphatase n=1 Tax=Novosphingobium bradum TaxID=1737444 RepID=A0ABV7IPX1_9SPHN
MLVPVPVLVVAAALIGADGRVCLQRRPDEKAHGGLWEFPGGKVEPGESPEGALARELAEELGIALDLGSLEPCGFAADGGLVILLYACRAWSGEAAALEGGAIGWFAPDALSAQPMPPLDYPLASQVCRLLSQGHI